MKKTELNKMNGGGCTSKKRKLSIAILSVLMTVGLALGVVFGIINTNSGGDRVFDPSIDNGFGGSGSSLAANSTWEDYDKTYHIKGSNTDKQNVWKEAVGTDNSGKKVLVIFDENWVASGSPAKFGTGDDAFSGTIMVGSVGNLSPLAIDGMLHIPSTHDVTLDLNGHKLNRNLTAAVAGGTVILSEGNLIITDSSGTNAGEIRGGRNAKAGGGIICSAGNLTLEAGTICDNETDTTAGGISFNGNTLTINGGVITENKQGQTAHVGCYGGGIAFSGTTFVMNGGTISKNIAETGGGIAITNGTFTMNGGIIGGSSAAEANIANLNANGGQGGGIHVDGTNATTAITVTINGGVISYNKSEHSSGGGLSFGENVNFNLKCVDIVDNVANFYGGGIMVRQVFNKTFHMSGGLVARNDTNGAFQGGNARGGGIYINTPTATITFSGGTVTANKLSGTNPIKGTSGVAVGMDASNLLGGGGGDLTKIYLNGPFICDGNENGDFDMIAGLVKFIVGDKLEKDGKSAHIGISPSRGNGGSIRWDYLGGTGSVMTSGYVANGNIDSKQVHFFASFPTEACCYGSNLNSNEVIINSVAQYGTTIASQIITGTWEWKTNGSATWATVPTGGYAGAPVQVSHGTTINAVRVRWQNYNGSGGTNATLVGECSTEGAKSTVFTSGTLTVPAFGSSAGDNRFQATGDAALNNPFPAAGIANIGSYTFIIDAGNWSSGFWRNPILNIEIVPAPVTLTLNNKTVEYGMDKNELDAWLNDDNNANGVISGLPAGETLSSMGIKLTKTYGTDANRTYAVRGTWDSAANANYKVTFSNSGLLTIEPRKVNILLNDEEVVYGGDVKEAEIKKINDKLTDTKILRKGFNNTQATDKDNNPRTDDGTSTGKPVYIGGWRYFDSTGTDAVASATDKKHQLVAR
ncbi:MAG: hypothetical protein K2N84_06440, partial [Clostridia bacterium]|nr:hypothetical protein [Clostridia bacterium]